MKITTRNSVSILPGIDSKINSAITGALNGITTHRDKFIVNDTEWFMETRKGKVRPCVVNSANYLSKTFQGNLASLSGWCGEFKLDNQNIDGFAEIAIPKFTGWQIDVDDLVPFLKTYAKVNGLEEHSIAMHFPMFYGMYVKRSFFGVERYNEKLRNFFNKVHIPSATVRIGVEFETGNIASAFRAFTKLNNLFLRDFIDIGVFITSNNKDNCAARIWPVSNRNGSFTELENRNYIENINLPLYEFGFEPDSFSQSTAYLGSDCALYSIRDSGSSKVIDGQSYQIFIGENGERLLRPE